MTNSDIKNTFAINDTIKKEFESIRAISQFTTLTNSVKTNLRNGEVKIHHIHNPYLAKIFDIAGGVKHDKGFEISVQPIDQKTTPDQQYKISALKSLWYYFLTGIEKGEDYFKNEFEATYKQLYLNNPERLFDMLNTDYTEGIFGYKHANESQKMTIAKYKKNEPIVFNEFSIFNYGFLNGVCDSFLNFITSKPTLKKQVNETSISIRANSDPATKKAVYKNLAEVWFFGFKHGNENKILNLENWETYKNEFYSFKISSYEDKYTLDEKKELERLKLAEIEAKEPDFDILKKRYLTYLNEVEIPTKTIDTKINFDPNQFNEDGAKLFNYLVENYIKTETTRGLQKRFTNVWHFMKNDNYKNNIYKFYFTKDKYKAYVFTKFNLQITNTDKSENKYNEVDLVQLKNHVLNFEDLYNS